MGTGKALRLVLMLALCAAAAAPAAAEASPGVETSILRVDSPGASAAAGVNLLTVNDQRGIDNRISSFIAPNLRLTMTAPEGLGDPDGAGANCRLDNAKPGESTATEVSCAPGYIGAIVGDLGGGNDSFDADSSLGVMVGAVIDGQRRPLAGGVGRDHLVGGGAADLLEGGSGADALIGAGGRDLLIGDGGPDKLNGGADKDACKGGGGRDRGKGCELVSSIP
ncbi:MAG: calcium-binding protein [Solirubrobacterales bacterium]